MLQRDSKDLSVRFHSTFLSQFRGAKMELKSFAFFCLPLELSIIIKMFLELFSHSM
jgi:hypothetical protein